MEELCNNIVLCNFGIFLNFSYKLFALIARKSTNSNISIQNRFIIILHSNPTDSNNQNPQRNFNQVKGDKVQESPKSKPHDAIRGLKIKSWTISTNQERERLTFPHCFFLKTAIGFGGCQSGTQGWPESWECLANKKRSTEYKERGNRVWSTDEVSMKITR